MRPTSGSTGSSPRSGRSSTPTRRSAASVITGAGRAFSAGGDLAMVERMTTDQAAVVEQWRDANAVVEAMLSVGQADRLRHQRRGRRRRAGRRPAGRREHHGQVGPDVRRPRPARRGRRRPCRPALATAVRHGQGQVLPADRGLRRRARGRAHRPGDQVRPRRGRGRRSAGRGGLAGRREPHRGAVDEAGAQPLAPVDTPRCSASPSPSRCSASSAPMPGRAWPRSRSAVRPTFPSTTTER